MAARRLNVHLKPLRQGDLDGLCGVYAVLNALQWLLPKARDDDYLSKLFGEIIGPIYKIKAIRDGGEEPELIKVFRFVSRNVSSKFKLKLELVELLGSRDKFARPDMAIEDAFKRYGYGAVIVGFEGLDSHWTVARGVTADEVILFDSWEYKTFDRHKFVWGEKGKSAAKSDKPARSDKIIVAPKDLNWIWLG